MGIKMKSVLVTGADSSIEPDLVEMRVLKGCKAKALAQYNIFS